MSAAEGTVERIDNAPEAPVSRQQVTEIIRQEFATFSAQLANTVVQAVGQIQPLNERAAPTSAPDTDPAQGAPSSNHGTRSRVRTPVQEFTDARAIDEDLPVLLPLVHNGQVVTASFIGHDGRTQERRGRTRSTTSAWSASCTMTNLVSRTSAPKPTSSWSASLQRTTTQKTNQSARTRRAQAQPTRDRCDV
jgi:hypothetical protein